MQQCMLKNPQVALTIFGYEVATLEGVAVGESYGEVVAELVGCMLISPVDMVEESKGIFGKP